MSLNEEQLTLDIVNLKADVVAIKETMVNQENYRHMLGLLEGIATNVKTIKDDQPFAIEWLKRIQTHIERQDQEIQAIKVKLQMS